MGDESSNPDGDYNLWLYGINDHLYDIEIQTGFQKTGKFDEDFVACCKLNNVVPHPALYRTDQYENEQVAEKMLAAQNILVDRVCIKILKYVLGTSLHLDTLKLSNCGVDGEMYALLAEGLAEEKCTIRTVVLDWNPIELSLDASKLAEEDQNNIQKLDELEMARCRAQAERSVTRWCERLYWRTGAKEMGTVVQIALQPMGAKEEAALRKILPIKSKDDLMSY